MTGPEKDRILTRIERLQATRRYASPARAAQLTAQIAALFAQMTDQPQRPQQARQAQAQGG